MSSTPPGADFRGAERISPALTTYLNVACANQITAIGESLCARFAFLFSQWRITADVNTSLPPVHFHWAAQEDHVSHVTFAMCFGLRVAGGFEVR